MGDDTSKIICPHCGAENPKSLIVTTCLKCLGSLEGAQPGPVEPRAKAPAPEPASRAPVQNPPAPPVRAPVMPPEPIAPEQPVAAERQPEALPGPAPADASVLPPPRPPAATTEPPALAPRAPYRPPPSPPAPPPADPAEQVEAFVRDVTRSLRGSRTPLDLSQLGPEQRTKILVVLGAVLFGVAVITSAGGHPNPLLPIVVCGIVGFLVFLVVRAIVGRTTYEVTAHPGPWSVALGQTFTWGVNVRAKKPFATEAGRIVLRCREHAVRRAGKNTSHYRHTIYEKTYPIPARQFGPGEAAALAAEVAIPASAIPSYSGRNNFIEWTLSLRAPVEGICPHVKQNTELRVMPMVEADGDTSAEGNPSIPAKWLEDSVARSLVGSAEEGPLSAMIRPADGQMPHALSVVGAGTTRELSLTLQSREDIHCRGVHCWIGCRIHGWGTREEVVVSNDVLVHQGALRGGQTLNLPLSVQVPLSGPVSYAGPYISFDWLVRVNLDVPLWWDRHVEVPFVVAPQLLQAGER